MQRKALSVEDFGKILLDSNDLDPVYVALYRMHSDDILDMAQLSRWILAYSCLYHCGAASYLSEFEGDNFFSQLMTAAKNEDAAPAPTGGRWPRGHERRHWRGGQAVASCQALHDRYGFKPELFLADIAGVGFGMQPSPEPVPFRVISQRVQALRGFGSWISFKLADMIDRLGLQRVSFTFDEVTVYKDPVQAAERLVRQRNGFPPTAQVKPEAVKAVFAALEEHFADYPAPPLYDRPVGLQEVESILCKWKSHQNGHYPLYNDLTEIHSSLASWAEVSEVARYFKASMPKVPSAPAALPSATTNEMELLS